MTFPTLTSCNVNQEHDILCMLSTPQQAPHTLHNFWTAGTIQTIQILDVIKLCLNQQVNQHGNNVCVIYELIFKASLHWISNAN